MPRLKTFHLLILFALLFSCQNQGARNVSESSKELIESFRLLEKRVRDNFRAADSTMVFAEEMLDLAESIGQSQYLGIAYNTKASAFELKEQYDSAITNYEEAKDLLADSGDTTNLSVSLRGLGTCYLYLGLHDLSLQSYQEVLSITLNAQDKPSLSKAYSNVGMVLMEASIHEEARSYYQKAIDIALAENSISLELAPLSNLSLSYLKQERYDSAIYYASMVKQKSEEVDLQYGIAKSTYILSQSYSALGDLDRAYEEAQLGESIYENLKLERDARGQRYLMARILFKSNKFKEALSMVDETLEENSLEELNVDLLQIRADILEAQGKRTEALSAYKDYIEAFSLLNQRRNDQLIAQQQFRFDTELKNQQIQTLEAISQSQTDTIRRKNLLITLAVLGAVLISLLIYFIYRQRTIKALHKEMMARQKLASAQLNPHFIFNALGAIQELILQEEDPIKTSNYLARFSTLTRQMLNYTELDSISLQDELDFCRNYLDLQKLRFGDKFDYQFEGLENINLSDFSLPPLITQPLVENSLEHGFKNRLGSNKITIDIKCTASGLSLAIEDNGLGIERTRRENERTGKSKALELTKGRLKFWAKQTGKMATMEILDLSRLNIERSGTRVTLNLPAI
ncbi:hypothetical protein BFP97_06980 [Roseivirga sp. 4D4]|uniref:tetratricopeptide repeat-containing sensor histidine kinase n=1 Tax=Roseivirga sp. 4D4 TaxID=1889784 RepID=UPI000852E1A3|nr:histidine kinase [Roseivirga sp. 4D4]OEK01270.1 hypothetical protein BFP97_06980 [Roseivirga sp. 4D4]